MTAASLWRNLSSGAHMLECARQVLYLVTAPGKRGVGHEIVMGRESALAVPAGAAPVCAFRVEKPTLGLVVEVGDHDLLQHLLVDGGVFHRNHDLYAAIEVARHPVGRGDEHPRLGRGDGPAVGEDDDPGMLQETTDDA